MPLLPDAPLGQNAFVVLALAAFGLATILDKGPAIALIVLGAVSLALSITRQSAAYDSINIGRWIFGVIALFAVLSTVGPMGDPIGSPPSWIFLATGVAWFVLGAAWLWAASNRRIRQIIYVLVLVTTASVGAIHVTSAAGVGFDVLFLHHEAADAIWEGESPYTNAVIVQNGAPVGAEFIEGYPYPPLTALAYAIGDWIGGDPRWTSLLGWLVALAVIGFSSLRRSGDPTPLGTMLAAAAIPSWPLVLTSGWTEPLSLALLAVAVAAWLRPGISGSMTGLFFGSKQYLLAGTPLLVFNRLTDRWTRTVWAALAFLISLLPVLTWGLADFTDAAIRFHLEAPARVDGTSVVGLLDLIGVSWVPPIWLILVAVGVVLAAVRRHVEDASTWLAALGAVLSTALFFSSQAFTNYWFLMAGIAALAAVSSRETTPAT